MEEDVSNFISFPPEFIWLSYEITVKINEIYDKDLEYFYIVCKVAFIGRDLFQQ